MTYATIPSDLRTLMNSTPGDRVVVDCVLRMEGTPNRAALALERGMPLRVRAVEPTGVSVTLPDGSDLWISADCASYVKVEPAGRPRRRRRRRLVPA